MKFLYYFEVKHYCAAQNSWQSIAISIG